jgi:hypothetical protein
MIYPSATVKEVLEGWAEFIKDGILADLLFLTLFIRIMLDPACNTEAIKEEPELIELLRLSYWYQRCRRMNSQGTFVQKVQEIREELGEGVRTKMEKYRVFSNLDNSMDTAQYYLEVLRPVLYALSPVLVPNIPYQLPGFFNNITYLSLNGD